MASPEGPEGKDACMGSTSRGTSCQSVSTGTSTTPVLGFRASQALDAGSKEAARLLPASYRESAPALHGARNGKDKHNLVTRIVLYPLKV